VGCIAGYKTNRVHVEEKVMATPYEITTTDILIQLLLMIQVLALILSLISVVIQVVRR